MQKKIDVQPNVVKLRKQMTDMENDPTMDISKMNLPEYLVYMSKQNCNIRAIINAIQLSCESKNLDIQIFPVKFKLFFFFILLTVFNVTICLSFFRQMRIVNLSK